MTTYISVAPAYGRTYKTQAEVRAGFNAGHDFRILDPFVRGSYVNKSDLPAGSKLDVHYGKNGSKRLIIP